MTGAYAVILTALLCGAPGSGSTWDRCEEAEIVARTCEAAEAWLRDALRPGQTLRVISCEAAS
jgi:hypothetical protein